MATQALNIVKESLDGNILNANALDLVKVLRDDEFEKSNIL